MNYKIIGKIISQILAIEAVLMLPAVVISVCDGEMNAAKAFLVTMGITFVFSGIFALFSRNAKRAFMQEKDLYAWDSDGYF